MGGCWPAVFVVLTCCCAGRGLCRGPATGPLQSHLTAPPLQVVANHVGYGSDVHLPAYNPFFQTSYFNNCTGECGQLLGGIGGAWPGRRWRAVLNSR